MRRRLQPEAAPVIVGVPAELSESTNAHWTSATTTTLWLEGRSLVRRMRDCSHLDGMTRDELRQHATALWVHAQGAKRA